MDNVDFNFFCRECSRDIEYRRANCFTSYRIKRVRKGEYIAFRGGEVRDLTTLVEGSIIVSLVLESGIIVRSTIHHAPYPIGAMALFDRDSRYRVDILSREDSTIISVSREAIEQQMVECRDFMRSFISYPSTKFDIIVEHLSILTQRSVSSKLAYYIFLQSDSDGGYHFDRSVERVAQHLCVERPSLSRTISQLVEQGFISYERGKGVILDPERLRDLII